MGPRAMMAARQSEDPEISGGVECESEQIEGDQDAGEGFLAVPKVVFEIVTVGLEHVEGLVFDLPTGAAAGGQFGDSVACDGEIGDEAVVIGSLALGVEGLDGEPVDQDGIVRGAQRHGVEPAVGGGGALAAFADGLTMFLQFGALQVFSEFVVCEAGLQVRMKLPPASWMAATIGWQANRSSPR